MTSSRFRKACISLDKSLSYKGGVKMAMRKSFSVEIAEIAEQLRLPKTTVEAVLRARLAQQIESLKRGETVTEEGLFTIKAVYDEETGKYTYRGSVSGALKNLLSSDGEKNLRLLSGVAK